MSTTAFGLGSKYFALYEVAGVGIQWHTFSQSPVEGDDFNLLLSMMMLIVDAVVYGVLTWYIEAVHPGMCGQWGMRAPLILQKPPCWGPAASRQRSALTWWDSAQHAFRVPCMRPVGDVCPLVTPAGSLEIFSHVSQFLGQL